MKYTYGPNFATMVRAANLTPNNLHGLEYIAKPFNPLAIYSQLYHDDWDPYIYDGFIKDAYYGGHYGTSNQNWGNAVVASGLDVDFNPGIHILPIEPNVYEGTFFMCFPPQAIGSSFTADQSFIGIIDSEDAFGFHMGYALIESTIAPDSMDWIHDVSTHFTSFASSSLMKADAENFSFASLQFNADTVTADWESEDNVTFAPFLSTSADEAEELFEDDLGIDEMSDLIEFKLQSIIQVKSYDGEWIMNLTTFDTWGGIMNMESVPLIPEYDGYIAIVPYIAMRVDSPANLWIKGWSASL